MNAVRSPAALWRWATDLSPAEWGVLHGLLCFFASALGNVLVIRSLAMAVPVGLAGGLVYGGLSAFAKREALYAWS